MRCGKGQTAAIVCDYTLAFKAINAPNEQKGRSRPVLEANFQCAHDRAWKTYQECSSRLQNAARKALESGLACFQSAEEIMKKCSRHGWATSCDHSRPCAAALPGSLHRTALTSM